MPNVFVYGTLMKGRKNHSVMESINAKFLGEASVASQYRMVNVGPFPALVQGREGAWRRPRYTIHGEVYSVTNEGMRRLDMFEGAPNLYHRDVVMANLKPTEIVPPHPEEDAYDDYDDWEYEYGQWLEKYGHLESKRYEAMVYVFSRSGDNLSDIDDGIWTEELDRGDNLPKLVPSHK